jgi:hypothetical protein
MSWKIRNEEQFEAWWESHGRIHPSPADAARGAWDEAHKQRDEASNLIIGQGFWGRAVSNVSAENKRLKKLICDEQRDNILMSIDALEGVLALEDHYRAGGRFMSQAEYSKIKEMIKDLKNGG